MVVINTWTVRYYVSDVDALIVCWFCSLSFSVFLSVPVYQNHDNQESSGMIYQSTYRRNQEKINLCLDLIRFGMISSIISFDGVYYEYNGGGGEK